MESNIMDKANEQMIMDRFEIIDVFNRYAIGVDKRDKELYGSCFTDELDVNVTGEVVKLKSHAWVDMAFSAVGAFEKTQHIIANHTININGDEADAVAYLQAHHFNKGNTWSVWGYYSNKFVRTSEGWKINSLKLTMEWHNG